MTESGNSAIRSLLQNRFIRIPVKLVLGLIAFFFVIFAAAAIYNAFDEDLSAQAKALLPPPPMGKVENRNGYIAFLGMVAPSGQAQMDWGRKAAAAFTSQAQPGFTPSAEWKDATRSHIKVDRRQWCKPDCLNEAKRDSKTVAKRLAEGGNAELLKRYRMVREAPEFADLYMGPLSLDIPGAYSILASGALLSLSDGALKANAGDPGALVAELEREVQFHRRIIAGGQLLLTVLTGEALLARDLLAISELLRSGGKRFTPYHDRLRALTRPQISATAIQPAFRHLAHEKVGWAQHWRSYMKDNSGLPNYEYGSRPLTNWVMSFFIQPNATTNLVAAAMTAEASLAAIPAAQFDREVVAIRMSNDALLERSWYVEWRNPVGKGVAELATVELGKYAARMNDLQALERMVDLQMLLAGRGVSDPAAIAAFVSGEGAKSNPDPYSGKAFTFDPATRLLSYQPRADGRWSGELKKRYGGRVAIAI